MPIYPDKPYIDGAIYQLKPDQRMHQLRVDREGAGGYKRNEVHDALLPGRWNRTGRADRFT